MELEAVCFALEFAESRRAPFQLSQLDRIVVRTDSQYVAENVDRAAYDWSQNRWTKAGGGAVLNIKDWKRLLTTLRRYDREHRLSGRVETPFHLRSAQPPVARTRHVCTAASGSSVRWSG